MRLHIPLCVYDLQVYQPTFCVTGAGPTNAVLDSFVHRTSIRVICRTIYLLYLHEQFSNLLTRFRYFQSIIYSSSWNDTEFQFEISLLRFRHPSPTMLRRHRRTLHVTHVRHYQLPRTHMGTLLL